MSGAGDGVRTRDIQLGRLTLCQLSYSRPVRRAVRRSLSVTTSSAIAERAYQQALSYARERRQGRAPGYAGEGMSPIVEHADVKRMLLTMKALTAAARAICYLTAEAIDRAERAPDDGARRIAQERASLLTPVAEVIPGSPAANAGVVIGDTLTEVDGQPATSPDAVSARRPRRPR